MNAVVKKGIRQFVAVAMLATSAWVVPMIQAQDTPTFTTAETVNVRTGDGVQYSVRATVNGTLTVTGRNAFDSARFCTGRSADDNDMWLRVDNNGVEGWVARCAGDFEGSVSALPVVTPSNAVLSTSLSKAPVALSGDLLGDKEPAGKFVIAYTSALYVNVRENPSTTANKLGVLRTVEAESTAIYVIGRTTDGYWAQVQYTDGDKTITGWVARYLLLVPNGWSTKVDAK